DARLGKCHAPVAGVARFVDDLGDMQQCLRRDAPAIETDAAGILFLVDERDLHPKVSRIKGRRISTRARAQYRYLNRFRHQPTNERRRGCSITSTTQRRIRIASAPWIRR